MLSSMPTTQLLSPEMPPTELLPFKVPASELLPSEVPTAPMLPAATMLPSTPMLPATPVLPPAAVLPSAVVLPAAEALRPREPVRHEHVRRQRVRPAVVQHAVRRVAVQLAVLHRLQVAVRKPVQSLPPEPVLRRRSVLRALPAPVSQVGGPHVSVRFFARARQPQPAFGNSQCGSGSRCAGEGEAVRTKTPTTTYYHLITTSRPSLRRRLTWSRDLHSELSAGTRATEKKSQNATTKKIEKNDCKTVTYCCIGRSATRRSSAARTLATRRQRGYASRRARRRRSRCGARAAARTRATATCRRDSTGPRWRTRRVVAVAAARCMLLRR